MKTSGTPLNDFADQIVSILKSDPRFVGTSRGRLVSKGDIDEYSDLDLDLVVEGDDYSRVMATRLEFAASLGHLLLCIHRRARWRAASPDLPLWRSEET